MQRQTCSRRGMTIVETLIIAAIISIGFGLIIAIPTFLSLCRINVVKKGLSQGEMVEQSILEEFERNECYLGFASDNQPVVFESIFEVIDPSFQNVNLVVYFVVDKVPVRLVLYFNDETGYELKQLDDGRQELTINQGWREDGQQIKTKKPIACQIVWLKKPETAKIKVFSPAP